MKSVRVDDIVVGSKLAKDIYLHHGVLYLTAGTIVDEYVKERLRSIGTHRVYVIKERKSSQTQSDRIFQEHYKTSVSAVGKIMESARSNSKMELSEVNEVVDMLNQIILQPNIVSRLFEIRSQDQYTFQHSINVAIICTMIGNWLNYSQENLNILTYSGLLHDIGKCQIPLDILNKPGPLTSEEYDQMKHHTIYGYKMLNKAHDLNQMIHYSVLFHHEREDSGGYPFGLSSDKIPEAAKIVAVADTFDAMTSDRVYRKKMDPFTVAEKIMQESFQNLNPKITYTFLHHICNFFVGSNVHLNNSQEGQIICINPYSPTRPIVRVGDTFYDLSQDYSLQILHLVD